MYYSIFTDASFSNTHKLATYAYCIISDEIRFKKSGDLKTKCTSSAEAEAAAICNALYFLIQHHLEIAQVGFILIQTDSMGAMKKINKTAKEGTIFKTAMDLLEKIRELNGIAAHLNFYEIRHIKAHVKKSDRGGGHHINHWCDREAKSQMGKLLLLNKKINTDAPATTPEIPPMGGMQNRHEPEQPTLEDHCLG